MALQRLSITLPQGWRIETCTKRTTIGEAAEVKIYWLVVLKMRCNQWILHFPWCNEHPPPPDCFLTHLQCHRKGDPTHQPVNWCLCQMVFSFPSRHLCCCFKIPLGYIERSPSSATDMPKLASDSGINLVASGMNLNNLAAVNPCFVGFMQELAD